MDQPHRRLTPIDDRQPLERSLHGPALPVA
jgi:hypothetical protein